jgi:hypothetical protein
LISRIIVEPQKHGFLLLEAGMKSAPHLKCKFVRPETNQPRQPLVNRLSGWAIGKAHPDERDHRGENHGETIEMSSQDSGKPVPLPKGLRMYKNLAAG